MTRRLILLLALSIAVGACGGGGGDAISDAAAESLNPRIAAIRNAAQAGQADVAAAEIAAIRTEVESLKAAGDLTDSGAQRIIDAATAVEAQLALITTTTTTAPPPPPTTSRPRSDDDDDDDKGRGKGEDKDDD